MRPQAIVILAVLFLVALLLMSVGPSTYRKVETMQTLEGHAQALRENHPELEHLEIHTLRLLQSSGAKIRLIDVRDAAAFSISHIPGAENAGTLEAFRKLTDLTIPENKHATDLFVFYGNPDPDAVSLAKKIREGRNVKVAHLAGGIFAWANAELPLENGDGLAVSTVSSGARFQRHLLRKELRHTNASE